MHLGPVGAGMGAKVVVNAVAHAVMVVLIEAGAMATKLSSKTKIFSYATIFSPCTDSP
jgi:3-hydroxyisobutyrate dehydrogenase-like beta-hydroxyacid dehydrogenase